MERKYRSGRCGRPQRI